jgi:hypothetical protein
MNKYKEITNNWNYATSCTLISPPLRALEHFMHLIFVSQNVHRNIFRKCIKSDPSAGNLNGYYACIVLWSAFVST